LISTNAWSAVYGDFDEDGRVDIALTNGSDRFILLNRGNRAFEIVNKTSVSPTGSTAFLAPLVEADDVNGDGHLDLIYRDTSSIWIALATGPGTFGSLIHASHPFAFSPWRYVDIDGDGSKDFVEFDRGTASAVTSRGDGHFNDPRTLAKLDASQGYQYAVGDFDGDGHLDLYIAGLSFPNNSFIEQFWWNDGHGNFPTHTDLSLSASQGPRMLLDAYDFDSDGAADILFQDTTTGATSLTTVRNRTIKSQPIEVAETAKQSGTLTGVADFDGDGKVDALFNDGLVAWGRASASSKIEATEFDLMTTTATSGAFSNGALVADVNADGIADIVSGGGGAGLFAVYGKRGSRSLDGGTISPTTGLAYIFATGDVNGDGLLDVVSLPSALSSVAISFGDGRGSFVGQPSPSFLTSSVFGSSIALGDLDHDGKTDLAFGQPAKVSFGNGAGGFDTPVSIGTATMIGTGTIDSNGNMAAFVVAGGNVQLATFGSDRKPTTASIFAAPQDARFFVADVDGDGISDVIVATPGGAQIVKKGTTGWSATAQVTSLKRTFIAIADFDGDDRLDLVTCDERNCDLSLATASGYAKATSPFRLDAGFLRGVAAADVDGDGKIDLVGLSAGNFGDPTLLIIDHNLGNGSFALAGAADAGTATAFFSRDVDGDGRPDVVLFAGGLEVIRNGCAPSRIHAAVTPAQPVEGGSARVVVNLGSATPDFGGVITLREGSRVLGQTQAPNPVFPLTSLAAGTHTYTISWDDQYIGHFEETLSVVVPPVTPRRRNVKH